MAVFSTSHLDSNGRHFPLQCTTIICHMYSTDMSYLCDKHEISNQAAKEQMDAMKPTKKSEAKDCYQENKAFRGK